MNRDEVLPKIERAAREKATTLDLSDNQITGLTSELGNLSKLQYLELSGNQLTELPRELGNLSQLQTLNLHGNELPILLEILEDPRNPARIINYYLQLLRGRAKKAA